MRLKDWNQNLKIRLAGESLVNITFWMFYPFLAIYFTESFGSVKAGFLLVFSQVFAVAANLFGGYCADRFGRKKMMVMSAAGQGIGYAGFALASSPMLDSPIIGFICFTAISMLSSFYYPASQAMVADVVKEKDRSSVFAVFYTSTNIAVVIGPILGGFFFAAHRFELLAFAAILNLILAAVLQRWTDETAPPFSAESREGSKWTNFLFSQIKNYRVILQDRIFLLFILSGILVSQTFMQLDLLIPVYTKEMMPEQSLFSLGDWSYSLAGEKAYGFLIAENGLLVAIFTISVTKWMMRYQEKYVFILSSLVYGLSMALFGSTTWIWGLAFAMVLFSLAELMTAGIQQGFIFKMAPEQMRAQYFAAASLRYTIGRMLAPLAIPLTSWFGYGRAFAVLVFLAVISSGLYYAMFTLFEKQKRMG